jgi:replicative DNA helicase
MRLVSTKAELTILKSAVHKNPSISGTVLSGMEESYLYNDFAIETFNRIQEQVKETGEVPSWKELCADPELSEETRERLLKHKIEPVESRKDALRMVRVLNKYRQLRGMYELSESMTSKLKKGKASVTEMLDHASESIANLRQARSDDAVIVKFGKGNNATALVKSLLDKDRIEYLPTLFNEFDLKNGGIGFGNLFTIGGSSGAGKSSLAMQLAINWSLMGEHVVMVPLEMTEREMTARVMANASGLDNTKIIYNKLTENEKEIFLKGYKKFVRARKKEGGTLSFFKPKSDMTIEEIMACTYTMGPRVVIVDYISLLKGVDGEDQWRQLGAVARYCKIYAEAHGIIVVLLCQVNEEGKIRYAQAIKEHSNYCWTFVGTKESRDAQVLNITQIKARNGELFDFTLRAELATMRIRSMTDEERDHNQSRSNTTKKNRDGSPGGKSGKSGKGKEPEYLKDISDDD